MELTEIYSRNMAEVEETSIRNLNEILLPCVKAIIASGQRRIVFSIRQLSYQYVDPMSYSLGYEVSIKCASLSVTTTMSALTKFAKENNFEVQNDSLIWDATKQDENFKANSLNMLFNEVHEKRNIESKLALETQFLPFITSYINYRYKKISFKCETLITSEKDATAVEAYSKGYDVAIILDCVTVYSTSEAFEEFCKENSLHRENGYLLWTPKETDKKAILHERSREALSINEAELQRLVANGAIHGLVYILKNLEGDSILTTDDRVSALIEGYYAAFDIGEKEFYVTEKVFKEFCTEYSLSTEYFETER